MRADFICTLNKLLEEKHIHFNTYCWIWKHTLFYIKKTFRKKINRVFAQKLFWLWELSLWNTMHLTQLGSSYSRCGVADAAIEGCYITWGTGGPRTSGPMYPPHFQAPMQTPQLVRRPVGSASHQHLGKKAASPPKPSAFILVDCKSS